MPTAKQPLGVMTADYGVDRRHKPHLIFRLRSRALMAADAFRRFTPDASGPSILDLGAAEGATLAEVHRLLSARRSLGIEYAAELIEKAPALPEGCELVQGDVTEPSPRVTEASFDLVLALAVLEHLVEPAKLFVEAHRALKPGGIFVATCPSGTWDHISGLLRLHPDEHHEKEFDRALFETLAGAAQLRPLEYRRFMFAPVAFLPYLRVPVSPRLQRSVDAAIGALRFLNFGFVNQLFVAQK
jgi:SAM-dependent methyltransferase